MIKPTCPNCGEIVMEGYFYCSPWRLHFKWNFAVEMKMIHMNNMSPKTIKNMIDESIRLSGILKDFRQINYNIEL